MVDLQVTREKIDKVDQQIVALFQERMELAGDVAEYKREVGKPVFDREREQEKLKVLGDMADDECNRRSIQELFAQIMSLSRKFQYGLLPKSEKIEKFECLEKIPVEKGTKVVYFGVAGTHTHQAMGEFFGDDIEVYNALTFREVMEMVQNGDVEYGVLPIENSSTGGIMDNYDLLMEYDNYIVGEHCLKINQALLGVPEATMDTIKTVYSHPQGLLQCSAFFEQHPEIVQKEAASTASAAMKVAKEQDITQAAIAGTKAAECYGLKVLHPSLNKEDKNSTRFLVISRRPMYFCDSNKISVCFEIPHESGTLVDILSHFKFNGLNMTKIESRPISGRTWEYRFVIEFEGNLNDAGVKNALNGIFEEAVTVKVLGNFVTQ